MSTEQTLLPHLNAAFNFARWVSGNTQDAEDIVQEACLRAFKALDSLQPGSDSRAWFLTIVRNTGWTWLRRNRGPVLRSDTGEHSCDLLESRPDPEAALIRQTDVDALRRALEDLPIGYREVLELREIEGRFRDSVART